MKGHLAPFHSSYQHILTMYTKQSLRGGARGGAGSGGRSALVALCVVTKSRRAERPQSTGQKARRKTRREGSTLSSRRAQDGEGLVELPPELPRSGGLLAPRLRLLRLRLLLRGDVLGGHEGGVRPGRVPHASDPAATGGDLGEGWAKSPGTPRRNSSRRTKLRPWPKRRRPAPARGPLVHRPVPRVVRPGGEQLLEGFRAEGPLARRVERCRGDLAELVGVVVVRENHGEAHESEDLLPGAVLEVGGGEGGKGLLSARAGA